MGPFQGNLLQLATPREAQRLLAQRVRDARLHLQLKQSTLAHRSGVPLATLRHFEQAGEISLKNLMRLCHALGRLDEVEKFLRPPPAATMNELERQVIQPARKRGSR